MILLEKYDIDPPIPKIVDDYTFEVAKRVSKTEMYNKGQKPKRKTPEIEFDK